MVVHDVEKPIGESPHTEESERCNSDREDSLPLADDSDWLAMLDIELLDDFDGFVEAWSEGCHIE